MKIIFTSFEKKTINSLPRILFPGNMIVIDKAEDTDAAVEYLLGQDILGVDTETRPSFSKGMHFQVSLLQVSTRDTCYLFRLHLTGMTPAIIRFLEDKKVPKVGLSCMMTSCSCIADAISSRDISSSCRMWLRNSASRI